jgi:uncharacterized membrane protein
VRRGVPEETGAGVIQNGDISYRTPGRMAAAASVLGRTWLLAAVLAACILRLWIAPLPSSFWVDEMATVFVVQHGAADPSFQAAPQVPASLYYVLPRLAHSLFGVSEIGYRLPSVLLMLAALLAVARLAQRLIHPDAGWFAALACFLLREFNYQAADARPYALGTCMACASLLFLVRWLDSGRWLDSLGFVAFGTLVWRSHLLFWPIYVVFAVYTLVRLLRRQSKTTWLQAGIVYAALGVSLLPVLREAWELSRQASAHVVADIPSGGDFSRALKLGFVVPFCAVSALLGRWLRWPLVDRPAPVESVTLILALWLCDPVCLFLLSRVSGESVFLSRYLYLALPGIALTGTLAAAVFLPRSFWRPMAAVLGIGILIFAGRWNHLAPEHHNSDWRAASRAINREVAGADVPILCPSPFIEARPPVWWPGYPASSFLYSHLAVYPVRGTVYRFPFETSPQAERFAAELSQGRLSASKEFIVYGGDRVVRFWRNWFSARPELAGWRIRGLGAFGDVEVLVFERPA